MRTILRLLGQAAKLDSIELWRGGMVEVMILRIGELSMPINKVTGQLHWQAYGTKMLRLSRSCAVLRYKDLDYSTQLLLVTILATLLAIVVLRSAIFVYRNVIGVPQQYPLRWTAEQCRLMNAFRLFIGLALSTLWIALFVVAPQMPTNWPFGLLEAISLGALLLLTDGWILLVLPRDWGHFGRQTKSFSLTITALSLWWALMLGCTVWILAKASVMPTLPVLKMPVVAVVGHALNKSRLEGC